MTTQIITGIVLDSFAYKDNDKIISIFSKEKGLLNFYAPGVKKNNSKNKFSLELFSISEFEIFFSKHKLSKLKRGKIIKSNLYIAKNYNLYLFFTFLLDVIQTSIDKLVNNKEIYELIEKLLIFSSDNSNDDWIIPYTYVLYKTLECTGSKWNLNYCYRCFKHKYIKSFSFKDVGFICTNCLTKDDEIVDMQFLKLIYKWEKNNNFDEALLFAKSIKDNNIFLLLYFLFNYYNDVLGYNYFLLNKIIYSTIFIKVKKKLNK